MVETKLPIKAVIREFKEETGIWKLPNKFKYLFSYNGYNNTGIVRVYETQITEKEWLKIAPYKENDNVTHWKLQTLESINLKRDNLLDSVKLWIEHRNL